MRSLRIFYVPFPEGESIHEISNELIHRRLAGCTQIFPVNASFVWEGKMELVHEQVLLIKTINELTTEVEQYLQQRHPYEVPCLMHWEAQVNETYYEWIKGQCL